MRVCLSLALPSSPALSMDTFPVRQRKQETNKAREGERERQSEREKKLHVRVSPVSSLSVCIPVVNLLIIENVQHRSQLFRGGAKR